MVLLIYDLGFLLYVLLAIAGFGTTGTTLVLNSFISKYYPTDSRATGLGMALGVGRIGSIIAPLVSAGMIASIIASKTVDKIAIAKVFYLIAIPGIIAAIVVFLIPTKHRNETL